MVQQAAPAQEPQQRPLLRLCAQQAQCQLHQQLLQLGATRRLGVLLGVPHSF
jgi:hypothetical protein